MIRFDTEEEAREYVNRWLDEQPSEDLRSTVTDLILLLFMEQDTNEGLEVTEVRINPDRDVPGAEFVTNAIDAIRACVEPDEMLTFAEEGMKAEPGSRYEHDVEDADA